MDGVEGLHSGFESFEEGLGAGEAGEEAGVGFGGWVRRPTAVVGVVFLVDDDPARGVGFAMGGEELSV